MADQKLSDLTSLQAEQEAAIAYRDRLTRVINRLQARRQSVNQAILRFSSNMQRIDNARAMEEQEARLVGFTVRNPQAKDLLENLGLEPEHAEILGKKGLGFRAIYQLQEPHYTSDFLIGAAKDFLQRRDKLSPKDASEKAKVVIADLQKKLFEHDIDLDAQK